MLDAPDLWVGCLVDPHRAYYRSPAPAGLGPAKPPLGGARFHGV